MNWSLNFVWECPVLSHWRKPTVFTCKLGWTDDTKFDIGAGQRATDLLSLESELFSPLHFMEPNYDTQISNNINAKYTDLITKDIKFKSTIISRENTTVLDLYIHT